MCDHHQQHAASIAAPGLRGGVGAVGVLSHASVWQAPPLDSTVRQLLARLPCALLVHALVLMASIAAGLRQTTCADGALVIGSNPAEHGGQHCRTIRRSNAAHAAPWHRQCVSQSVICHVDSAQQMRARIACHEKFRKVQSVKTSRM